MIYQSSIGIKNCQIVTMFCLHRSVLSLQSIAYTMILLVLFIASLTSKKMFESLYFTPMLPSVNIVVGGCAC